MFENIKKPVPLEDISKCVHWLIELAVKNGANSISMPDEFVSVAHFVCFPDQYYIERNRQLSETDKLISLIEHQKN